MFSDDEPELVRLRAACAVLPASTEFVSHGRPCFKAGEKGKVFAVYGGGEKRGPGEHRRVDTALLVKIEPAELTAVDEDPRFFVPAYYGPSGWRAVDLADDRVDDDEVAELLDASFRLVAGKRLLAQLDAPGQ